jgi:hypothetical protein
VHIQQSTPVSQWGFGADHRTTDCVSSVGGRRPPAPACRKRQEAAEEQEERDDDQGGERELCPRHAGVVGNPDAGHVQETQLPGSAQWGSSPMWNCHGPLSATSECPSATGTAGGAGAVRRGMSSSAARRDRMRREVTAHHKRRRCPMAIGTTPGRRRGPSTSCANGPAHRASPRSPDVVRRQLGFRSTGTCLMLWCEQRRPGVEDEQ